MCFATEGEIYDASSGEVLPPSEAPCQLKTLEMGYDLSTQMLILPTPQGFLAVYFLSHSSYSSLPSRRLAQPLANKHTFTYKTERREALFICVFNVLSSEITSSFLSFVVLLQTL